MRCFVLILLIAVSSCRFDSGGNAGADGVPDANQDEPDAAMNEPDAGDPDAAVPDATPAAPDADPLCGFPFDPTFFDPCIDPVVGAGDLTVSGNVEYNTDLGTFSPPVGGGQFSTSDVNGVNVIWTQTFRINSTGSIRVVGSKPLMIVATGDININGDVDASSLYDGVTFDLGAGATSDPSACANPPGPGIGCANHGASAGGGGGFGTAGGEGDHGAKDRDGPGCTDGEGPEPGGLLVPQPTTIRGGCAGAPGDFTTTGGSGDEGLGGPGGGAIHLVSGGELSVDAVIHVGGGGGGPGLRERASGGGAGSGGYIGLEAIDITLLDEAVLASNGGGGGGGCDGGPATVGENSKPDDSVAQGGPKGGGDGDGNNGGFRTTAPGIASTNGDRGGGGGGGAVGYILLRVRGGQLMENGSPIVSPPAIEP